MASVNVIKRRAKIFEAGDYPDRGGNYPEAELDKWIENHKERDIPLSVGHLDLPSNPFSKLGEFGMGFLKNLQRIGRDLFADVFIDEDVNRLLERGASKAISIGVDRDAGLILEASLVADPRVATAALFHKNVAYQFAVDFDPNEGAPTTIPQQEGLMSTPEKGPEQVPQAPAPGPQVDAKFAADFEALKARAEAAEKRADQHDAKSRELEQKLEFAANEKKFDALVHAGKLLPAEAKALLAFSGISTPVKITFSEGEEAKEMSAVDAIVQVFENHDCATVVQAAMPKNLRNVTPSEAFSKEDETRERSRAERLGLEGEELEKFVAEAKKLAEAIS